MPLNLVNKKICSWFIAGLVLLAQTSPAQTVVPPGEDYKEITDKLTQFIGHEVSDKQLPALSIALVDDQKIVWAQGFGFADQAKKIPATAETAYRVGSVSQLFTDIAVMQRVEMGNLDLDAPITKYLREFRPTNPFNQKPITLRELMSHRAGLLREPPHGQYSDSAEQGLPDLRAIINSLARTALVYPPGEHTKYSNAGTAVVGEVLERQAGHPLAEVLRDMVLKPIGLQSSAFDLSPDIQRNLANGVIQTYHGKIIDAPASQLNTNPAEGLYSTVLDIGRFASILLAGGRAGDRQILQPGTLKQMWTPQYSAETEGANFGLGFRISSSSGQRIIGDSGAIDGFATELEAMPDAKLAVVVIAALDSSSAVVTHIAHEALRMALERRTKQAVEAPTVTGEIDSKLSLKLAGHYGSGDDAVDLTEEEGNLFMQPARGGYKTRLRKQGDNLIVDDKLSYGQRIELRDEDKAIEINGALLSRVDNPRPDAPSKDWSGLIGEYGLDSGVLYILERGGKLTALTGWFEYEPLEQISPDHYRYPSRGLYDHGDVVFMRDKNGVATKVKIGEVEFKRRAVGPDDGKIFRITPLKPIDQLRKIALAQQPPIESGKFRTTDLVELTSLDPTIKLDIRYATANDFLSTPMYQQARAFMQRPAAEALVGAHRRLQALGYGLLIHDAYRPWYVTRMFWDATPDPMKIFVADPSLGSRHNRGCAVDLTLYDLKTGQAVQMTGVYDEFSERSYPFYPGGTSLEHWYRDLLRREMEAQNFRVYETEWWHFDFRDWREYPIGNKTFEELSH
jgi:CubicO group peptidase (beta-lactamase class C family)/D-alanyl-D-alanine dipeptidase